MKPIADLDFLAANPLCRPTGTDDPTAGPRATRLDVLLLVRPTHLHPTWQGVLGQHQLVLFLESKASVTDRPHTSLVDLASVLVRAQVSISFDANLSCITRKFSPSTDALTNFPSLRDKNFSYSTQAAADLCQVMTNAHDLLFPSADRTISLVRAGEVHSWDILHCPSPSLG